MKPWMFWIALVAIVVGGLLNLLGGWAWPLPGLVFLIVWAVRTVA